MRTLFVLALFAAAPVTAATLNKCIDENGEITYTNLACAKTQAAKKIELDPPPPPEPPRTIWVPVQVAPTPIQNPVGQAAPPNPAPVSAPSAPAQSVLPQSSALLPEPPHGSQPPPATPVQPAASRPAPPPAASEIISPRGSTTTFTNVPSDPAPAPRPAGTTPTTLAASLCDVLTRQIGEVLDRMDAARHHANPEAMQTWQSQVQALEARRQASNCF